MLRQKDQVQYEYILDCIASDDEDLIAPQDKLRHFAKSFRSEFGGEWNRGRYPNLQEWIADYLRGLPSCCTVAYMNYEIREIGRRWGIATDDKKAAKFQDRWWSVLAWRIIQLCQHYKVQL